MDPRKHVMQSGRRTRPVGGRSKGIGRQLGGRGQWMGRNADRGAKGRGRSREMGRRGFGAGGAWGGAVNWNYRQETQRNGRPMQSMLNSWVIGGFGTWADQLDVNTTANAHTQSGKMRGTSSQQTNPIAHV